MEKIPIHLFWELGKDPPLILRLEGRRSYCEDAAREAADGQAGKKGGSGRKKAQGGRGFLFEIPHSYSSKQSPVWLCSDI